MLSNCSCSNLRDKNDARLLRFADETCRNPGGVAHDLRRSLGLEGRLWFPVLQLVEHVFRWLDKKYRFEVAERDEFGDSHGLTERGGDSVCIKIRRDIYDRAYSDEGRGRGTVAHEAWHYPLHARSTMIFVSSRVRDCAQHAPLREQLDRPGLYALDLRDHIRGRNRLNGHGTHAVLHTLQIPFIAALCAGIGASASICTVINSIFPESTANKRFRRFHMNTNKRQLSYIKTISYCS
jgi:hypothetical protein